MIKNDIESPKVVSRDEWLVARTNLLMKEKELTRARDALSAQRRELPWVRVEKEYVFDTPDGKKSLAEIFDGRSQLIVYHFMWTGMEGRLRWLLVPGRSYRRGQPRIFRITT